MPGFQSGMKQGKNAGVRILRVDSTSARHKKRAKAAIAAKLAKQEARAKLRDAAKKETN